MACSDTDHEMIGTRFCPECGAKLVSPARIDNTEQLQRLARKLGVRPDWHEPDEQEVTALVLGNSFDNAGFWPYDPRVPEDRCVGSLDSECLEMYVELRQAGEPVAHINLATLLAMACGTLS
jgi:hypothetical protein